jgi:S1-C subfamily serine protease
MKLRHNKLTSWVVNTSVIGAAGVFIGGILWQVLMPNVSAIAKRLTVRIDGANSGSGTLIAELGSEGVTPREYRYLALTNWHVVSPHLREPHSSFTLATSDGRQHRVLTKEIARVGKLDLAIVEFRTHQRYSVATLGNSDRLTEGDTLYVSGWADPSPQLPSRTYQFLVGNLSGRIDRDRDGYSLVYTVNAMPGMSGGPVFDRRGNLVGINGRATVDLRTGTVNSVLGIDINRYLRASGNLY